MNLSDARVCAPGLCWHRFLEDASGWLDEDIPSPVTSATSSSLSSFDTSPVETPTSTTTLFDSIFENSCHINILAESPPSDDLASQYLYFGSRKDKVGVREMATAITTATTTAMTAESADGLQIRILGVPSTGAKSRVETQIKLCLQLVMDETKTACPTWLWLAPDLLARPRPAGTSSRVAMPSEKSGTILTLDAKVICASHPDKVVRICSSCIRRERKRAERTKGAMATDTGMESNRILLFSSPPWVDFTSGNVMLPTRITCYCRHHDEKVGFRVQFTIRDGDTTIATSTSPPIMITDDHKSAGRQTQRPARKRSRTMTKDESNDLDALQLSIVPLATLVPRSTDHPVPSISEPHLERLIPSKGPLDGGVEVTVLGSGFHQGLTCLFGEHVATTIYWNSTTLVCILPPALQTGPIAVSFKEHPLIVDQGREVTFFTYFDTQDQALLELALQVVGLKMTGKLQGAKQIAMDIVQGNSASTDMSYNRN